MTDDVGVFAGGLTVAITALPHGQAQIARQYSEADEWYTLTGSPTPIPPEGLPRTDPVPCADLDRPKARLKGAAPAQGAGRWGHPSPAVLSTQGTYDAKAQIAISLVRQVGRVSTDDGLMHDREAGHSAVPIVATVSLHAPRASASPVTASSGS